jgi:hypothetical protein
MPNDSPVSILITGGSHVAALNEGFKSLTGSEEIPKTLNFEIRPLGGGLSISGNFFRGRSDHVEITNPKFRKRIKRIPPSGASYDAVVLSTLLYSRPVWYKADWAVYGVPGMSKGRLLASNGMLRRVILDDTKYLISFLKHLRTLGIAVCVVEGPRPFRHNVEVKRAGVEIVKYIDTLHRSLTLELLAREEIPVVHVPDFVFDDDGFMLEDYRSDNPRDKTHGNAAFGRLMMLKIVQYVQELDIPQSARLSS